VLIFSQIIKDWDECDVLSHWKKARLRFLAICEHRKGSQWATDYEAGSPNTLRVLCSYRTSICEELKKKGALVRVHGKGWCADEDHSRQRLPDWHINKLAYGRQSMFVLAVENVSHRSYITEKPFDALAMASIPVVFWPSDSTGFDFIHSDSVLNLYGMSLINFIIISIISHIHMTLRRLRI
jgi:hypothetical protein